MPPQRSPHCQNGHRTVVFLYLVKYGHLYLRTTQLSVSVILHVIQHIHLVIMPDGSKPTLLLNYYTTIYLSPINFLTNSSICSISSGISSTQINFFAARYSCRRSSSMAKSKYFDSSYSKL